MSKNDTKSLTNCFNLLSNSVGDLTRITKRDLSHIKTTVQIVRAAGALHNIRIKEEMVAAPKRKRPTKKKPAGKRKR